MRLQRHVQRTSRPRRSRFRQSSVVDETHMRGAPPPAATTGRTFSPCPYYLTTHRSIPSLCHDLDSHMLCGLRVQVRRRAR